MKLIVPVLFVLAACGGKASSTSTTPKTTQGSGAMGGATYAKAGSAAPMPANPCEGK
ncbi:MAG TPA: hypothetical protein VGM88_14720 [Kofleriaceae bacterium]|jgi:hypothetical protein